MTRLFCDRCDKECEALIAVTVEAPHENTLNHDICNGCFRKLADFFKPLPKEGPMIR